MSELTNFENRIMKMLLDGDHPLLENLRHQFEQCRVSSRKFTGVGFFTDFEVDARLAYGKINLELSDIHINNVVGIRYGIGIVLFIREGVLSFLEGYTYDPESYPENISQYDLSYLWKENPQFRNERDWDGLFESLKKKSV